MKSRIIQYFSDFKAFKWYQWLIYLILLIMLIIGLIFPISAIIILFVALFIFIIVLINNNRFDNDTNANGIIGGNRGKGKGMLLQFKAMKQKKYFSNVPMGYGYENIVLKEYIQSIGNNTIYNSINGTISIVEKLHKFEGVPVLIDDTTTLTPNFMDSELKKIYPSMPLTLAVNRHLYNSYMIISSQSFERPYKILRELQTDFFVEALKTNGFGKLWNAIPILRFFVRVKYRYYENMQSAYSGVLPFKALGLLNEVGKQAYLTSGQSTKEVFEASHGRIYESSVIYRKSKIKYDTRYFHKVFYGYEAPK